MEIWLDTIDLKAIKQAKNMGILHGVTTNPSILAKEPDPLAAIQTLLNQHEGPLAVQVLAQDQQKMAEQGRKLHRMSSRIIVKIPVTQEGLAAIHMLSEEGIPTMGTVVYHSHQALLALSAGAKYIAPYLAHLLRLDADGISHLHLMRKTIHEYGYDAKIIVASIHTLEQISLCIESGMHAITIKEDLFDEFIQDHEMTVERMEIFAKEWSAMPRAGLMCDFSPHKQPSSLV